MKMKLLLLLITLQFFLNASETDTIYCPNSGKSFFKYQKTSLIARLHNEQQRHYCNIYELLEDDKNYGVEFPSITFFTNDTKEYLYGEKLYFTNKKHIIKAYKNKPLNIKTYTLNEILAIAKQKKSNYKLYEKNITTKILIPRGKKVFKHLCKDDIDISLYLEISELKEDIKTAKLCKDMKEENLHALSVYLWYSSNNNDELSLKVGEKERCPVCAMFVAKYPRWVAQIFYKKDNTEHHFSFDGVKDMMKFYFNPLLWNSKGVKKEQFTKILVTDYYSTNAIQAKDAFFVTGSDTFGPMGHELIPFKTYEEAKTFKRDHAGEKIVRFDEITSKGVYKLDEK